MATKKNSSSTKKTTTKSVTKPVEEKVIKEDKKEIKEVKKIKKHLVVNIFCIILFIVSLVAFGFNVINSTSIFSLICSLLITIFTIIFVVVSITYKRNSKNMILVGSILLIGYFVLNIFNPNSSISFNGVPNFTNKSVTEVMKWASKNSITINQEYEYSDMIPEYRVISQNVKSGTSLGNINEITVSISEGANPSKEIIVPSMIGWDTERVLKFIKNNFLSNVNVEFVQSDMAKDTVINQSTSGNLKRDDEINLTFSYGEELDTSEVSLIDFTNESKFEVEFYMKQHQLKYKFEEEFSNKIKRGYAVKQSIAAGEKVLVNDTEIVVTISKGPKIKVPDLKKMDMTSITEWAINNKVKLNFSDSYDDTIKKNGIISTSVTEGDIIEQGTVIKVVLSRGNLKMPSFESIEDFYEWANKYNVKYEEQHEFSDTVEAGKVISYSYKTGTVIKNGDSIKVIISDGAKRTVPSVVGLSKNNACSKLENAGLNCSVSYRNSSESKDKVLSQSISAGSEVSNGTTVVISVSNGKTPTNNNNNNNNNNNGGGNTTPPPTPQPTCNQCSLSGIRGVVSANIDDGFNAVASALKSHIQSQCPGATVVINSDTSSGKPAGTIISGNPETRTYTTCDTITITLAK